MNKVSDAMKWRYATQKFDVSKKLSEVQISELLSTIILAPSSFGLQPWKFIVVTNPEVRAKLQEAGSGQSQISEASHLIVFAVEKYIDDALVDNYMKLVSAVQGHAIEDLKGYADMIKGSIANRTVGQNIEWATRQAYLALGVLVTAAAVEGIDVGPMEGFGPKKFDEILGLDKLGLESKVAAAVGFRTQDDPNLQNKKVRFPKDKVVIEIK